MAKKFYGGITLKKTNKINWEDTDGSHVVSVEVDDNITGSLALKLPSSSVSKGIAIDDDGAGDLKLALLTNENVDGSAAITESKLSLDFATSTLNTNIGANTSDIADLRTTQGTSDGDTNLGTFTGATITDNVSVKTALQELETSLETKAADADVIKKDGSVTYTGNQPMGSNKITGLADGTDANDAINKSQLDAAVAGLSWKDSVRVASSSNITISGPGATIDGVTMANDDRVLLYGQTASAENGIYIFNGAASAMTRSTDMDAASEFDGSAVFVKEGTDADKGYTQTATVVTVDTDAVAWTQFTGGGALTAGDGIDITGSTISVDHTGEGLTFTSNQLDLEIDGSTLSKSASGLKVADGGVTNTQVNASAAIAESKLSLDFSTSSLDTRITANDGDISDILSYSGRSDGDTNMGTFTGSTLTDSSNIRQLFQDIETAHEETDANTDDLVTLSGVTENSTSLGTFTGTTITDNSTIKTAIQELETALEAVDSAGQFAEDWTTAQGTSKTVTHSLGSSDVVVQVYDKANGETIEVDSIVRTDTNTVDLTSSEAPNGSSWRVMILAL